MKTLLTTIYHVTKSAKNHEEEEKRAENPCHSQYIIFMWIDDILKHNHQSSRAKVGMQPRDMKKEAKSCDLTFWIRLAYLWAMIILTRQFWLNESWNLWNFDFALEWHDFWQDNSVAATLLLDLCFDVLFFNLVMFFTMSNHVMSWQ